MLSKLPFQVRQIGWLVLKTNAQQRHLRFAEDCHRVLETKLRSMDKKLDRTLVDSWQTHEPPLNSRRESR